MPAQGHILGGLANRGFVLIFKGLVSCFLAMVTAASAYAQTSSFMFQATVGFDPNQIVGTSGGTLGALMTEFVGPSAAQGQLTVEGDIAYDLAQTPTITGASIGAYQTALTGVELRIGANVAHLDIPRVLKHAATSKVGTVIRSAGFCADFEHCQLLGVPNAPFGMQTLVLNDVPNTLLDENGATQFASNDILAFMAGRTDALAEFDPLFQTRGFGMVSLDGFALGLFSVPGTDFFTSHALPNIDSFVGTPSIERTEFWIFLEGPNLLNKVKLEGVVNSITPHAS
ncbi:hypothetical protein [Tateyamaria pelophila]|uniref:hypothetical protein n=1 Tax=Tateyamaria pelophila TaxID=328415 RepID=UPI001CBE2502|nr:hypothetical protein [Tateyamaria pelophila]